MNYNFETKLPPHYTSILEEGKKLNFQLNSDVITGELLRSFVASKPGANILELGTGVGLGSSWIIDGMDEHSTLDTVENDEVLLSVMRRYFEVDSRIRIFQEDGEKFILKNTDKKYDLIFADTWPGKFYLLDEVIAMLNPGGVYLIDDMKELDEWPADHKQKVKDLNGKIKSYSSLWVTPLDISTGIIICVRKKRD